MKEIKGISTGGGVVVGQPFIYRPEKPVVFYKENVDTQKEIERFILAAAQADREILNLATKLRDKGKNAEGDILDAQRALLEDEEFYHKTIQVIKQEVISAESAVQKVSDQIVEEFEAIEDSYFRQRAADVQDISVRLIYILTGTTPVSLADLNTPLIVVAHDLMPSDTAALDPEMALAICTEAGTATSHTAILARGLSIPAVVGCGPLPVKTKNTLIVDGSTGIVIINPKPSMLNDVKKRITSQADERKYLLSRVTLPTVSTDKVKIDMLANVGGVIESKLITKYGAEGIGLLRTETLFFEENTLPTEEEQYKMLLDIANALSSKMAMTIRMLDVGGDKPLEALQSSSTTEQNPFLGQRGIRFLLAHPELMRSQLRALLRLSAKRKIKIFFPMVSILDEVQKFQKFVDIIIDELKRENIECDQNIERGIMVEVPSAALNISNLISEVDFVSIGSNDLTQYTLAADRTNENLAHIANYFDPSILWLIQRIIEGGEKNHKDVEICGEMSGDPLAIPILVGLGIRTLSMSLARIPLAKEIVRTVSVKQCHTLAHNCLKAPNATEILKITKAWCKKNYATLNLAYEE